jgi:DNA repair protein RadC
MSEQPKLCVKEWAEEDRPREKLLLKGVGALSNAELLAIIIGSGNREETVVELSQRILLSADNDINRLGKFSIKELIVNFKGIGEAKAISIVAALELGKRRKTAEIDQRQKIITSRDIYNLFHPMLCDLAYEEFWALFLNRANRVVSKLKISQGGVSETIVDSKLIFKEALNVLASGVVLCHNHPSGNTRPSSHDDYITMKLNSGIKTLDMSLMDHVIVCDGSYYSYADLGRL